MDWSKHYKKMSELEGDTVQKNLSTLVAALKEENVSLVEMTYSGGGDSGDYHYPIYTVGEERLEDDSGYGPSSYTLESGEKSFHSEQTVALFVVNSGARWCPELQTTVYEEPSVEKAEPVALAAAVYEVMERAVESRHCGWYNNEGGEGTVTFDVEKGLLSVSHGNHYTETHWDEYSFSI